MSPRIGRSCSLIHESAQYSFPAASTTRAFPSLIALLNASDVEVSVEDFDSAKHGAAPSQLANIGTIYLPLAGLLDIEEEKKKLNKQKEDLSKWIKSSEAKLSNERFLAKAPEQVIADAKTQLEDLRGKLARVEELLNALNQ